MEDEERRKEKGGRKEKGERKRSRYPRYDKRMYDTEDPKISYLRYL